MSVHTIRQYDLRQSAAVLIAGGATVGALLLAGQLLFGRITTQPETGEVVSAIEAGNIALIALAIVTVLLTGVGLVGVYQRRSTVMLIAAIPLLILGVVGLAPGVFYLAMGIGLLIGYVLVR